jgi:hypothetical protein
LEEGLWRRRTRRRRSGGVPAKGKKKEVKKEIRKKLKMRIIKK